MSMDRKISIIRHLVYETLERRSKSLSVKVPGAVLLSFLLKVNLAFPKISGRHPGSFQ